MSEATPPPPEDARAQGRVGATINGKYRLDRVLGVGGMAIVYAATHRNQKRVAVKMLRLELSFVEEIRTRFLREGYVANTVGHPGALAVLDEDVTPEGAAFLVMELLEGKALDVIAKAHGGRLPENVVLAIGDQLLDVLAAAHTKNIIHRDIKPANLFITREGTLKVLDFGIARLRDAAGSEATRSGVMLGTPAFMGPEQAYGRTHEIDARSDIWAVGATLFNLVSGRNVHIGSSASEMVIKSATLPAPPLASASPDVHPRVAALIDRALSFEKEGRWASAGAMQAELRAVVRDVFPAVSSGREALLPLLDADGLEETPVASASSVAFEPTTAVPSEPDGRMASSNGAPAIITVPEGRPPVAPESWTAAPITTTAAPTPTPASTWRPALIGSGAGVAAVAVLLAMTLMMRNPKPSPATAETEAPAPPPSVQPSAVPAPPPPPPLIPAPAIASAPPPAATVPVVTPSAKAPEPTRRAPAPLASTPKPPAHPKSSDDDLFHP